MPQRAIIHVDMDAFFASVEQRDNPELRGRPVMVGGGSARGVVAAASYEARQFGVRSAMPGWRARRLCPEGVFVRSRFARYREVSATIFGIFQAHADQIEGLSLDEAFLDVTGAVAAGTAMRDIGRALKNAINRETGLTASVGMAPNKLLAKLASDYDKPDGFVEVLPEDIRRFLDPLPVGKLWGIGPRTTERLHDAGIHTAGQLRRSAPELLEELFGSQGPGMAERAAGIDDRPVRPTRVRRSISQETTFDQDRHDIESLAPVIQKQAAEVAARLRAKSLHARTVTLKLRSSGFSTVTRSRSLSGFTRSAEVIEEVAMALLADWAGWRRAYAVRLVGVGVTGLGSPHDGEQILDPNVGVETGRDEPAPGSGG